MQNHNLKNKNRTTLYFVLWLFAFGFSFSIIFSGCITLDAIEFFRPEGPPDANETFTSYYQTELKTSTSAEVISTIHLPEYELLSQSKSVVASFGEKKKKGFKAWFKMVSFDENELTAKRKYLFVEDERPKRLSLESWPQAEFDCAIVLDSKILEAPYSDNNTRRIAILKAVAENFRTDMAEVKLDNKKLGGLGMMVNQALEMVLVKLDSDVASPALAKKLSDQLGLKFNHINLNQGRIRMIVADDIAMVRMRLGSSVRGLTASDLYIPGSCPFVLVK